MSSKALVRDLDYPPRFRLILLRLVDLASVSLVPHRLRGFLVIFELIQLVKLAMVSLRRVMFSHTPRDIREMTKPGYFEYAIGKSPIHVVCSAYRVQWSLTYSLLLQSG
jgi:hypothetical protein